MDEIVYSALVNAATSGIDFHLGVLWEFLDEWGDKRNTIVEASYHEDHRKLMELCPNMRHFCGVNYNQTDYEKLKLLLRQAKIYVKTTNMIWLQDFEPGTFEDLSGMKRVYVPVYVEGGIKRKVIELTECFPEVREKVWKTLFDCFKDYKLKAILMRKIKSNI